MGEGRVMVSSKCLEGDEDNAARQCSFYLLAGADGYLFVEIGECFDILLRAVFHGLAIERR